MPTGTASSAARPMRMPVPTIAFAIPPPVSPTGFGIWVKKARSRAGTPRTNTKNSTMARGTSATRTAAAQSPLITFETSLRMRYRRAKSSGGKGHPRCRRPQAAAGGHAPDEQARDGVDGHGDHEQDEPDLHERVQVQRVRR